MWNAPRLCSTVRVEEAIPRTIGWERANPPGEFNLHRFYHGAEDAAISAVSKC